MRPCYNTRSLTTVNPGGQPVMDSTTATEVTGRSSGSPAFRSPMYIASPESHQRRRRSAPRPGAHQRRGAGCTSGAVTRGRPSRPGGEVVIESSPDVTRRPQAAVVVDFTRCQH